MCVLRAGEKTVQKSVLDLFCYARRDSVAEDLQRIWSNIRRNESLRPRCQEAIYCIDRDSVTKADRKITKKKLPKFQVGS